MDDDIKAKLASYQKVTSINKVPIGVHIRYFNDQGEFRTGGYLEYIGKDYIMLKNPQGTTWSVQKRGAEFWQKVAFCNEKKSEEQKQAIKKKETMKKFIAFD